MGEPAVAHEGHVHDVAEAGLHHVGGQRGVFELVGEGDGARLERIALDEALLLERLQVHVHGGGGGEAEALADLAHGRAVSLLPNALLDAVEHRLLALRHFLGHR